MDEPKEVIVFKLKKQKYAINLKQVISIEKMKEITKIPNSQEFIKGIVDFSDKVIPLIDLGEYLDFGKTDLTNETRMLITNIHNDQIALIVDSATDVITLEPELIDPPPQILNNLTNSMIAGVAKINNDLLILIDLEQILNKKMYLDVI